MFGIGDTELLLIAIFAFLLFGPDKLPELGKTVTKGLKQVKHAQDSVSEVVQKQMMDPMQKAVDEVSETVNGKDEAPQKEETEPSQSFAEQKEAVKKERAKARDLYNLDKGSDGK